MKTRADYLAGRCTHREYYAQFVTPEVRELVLSRFPLARLASTADQDPFNSIPLREWDAVAYAMPRPDIAPALRAAGDFPTLSGRVCILKEAARQVVEGA